MRPKTSFIRALACMALMSAAAVQNAQTASAAEPFPSKPITLTVAYPAGGGADVASRALAGPLQKALGQSVVVENRAGVAGAIATQGYFLQKHDGYRLLALTGNDATTNPLVVASAKYDPSSLRLIHPMIFSDMILVTSRKDAPADIDALIDEMRNAKGNEFSFGNWGIGSTPHLAASDLKLQTKTPHLDVQYKGVSPIIQDLLGGQVDYAFLPLISAVLDLVQSGRLKAVSMATKTRNPLLPDVPAAGESKYLKNFDYRVWPAVFVHRDTPEDVVKTLHEAVATVINGDAYQKWSTSTGNRPMTPMTLQEADEFYRQEIERVRRIAEALDLKAQ